MSRATHRTVGTPRPAGAAPRAAGDIVEELACTPHPDVARDPDESLAVLERLINEARRSVQLSRDRNRARPYSHVDSGFSRTMQLVDNAPAYELRALTKFVIDQLWGVGLGTSKGTSRRLQPDRDWEGFGILPAIAQDIRVRSFFPFAKPRQ